MNDIGLENLSGTDLIYKLLTEQGRYEGTVESKLDQVLENQRIMNERINKRESETEDVVKEHNDLKLEFTRLKTTIDIIKIMIGGALTVAGLALAEGILDKL